MSYGGSCFRSYLNQFQSRDPFAGYARLPATLNGYSYAHNNPINYTDPSGRCIVGYSGEVRMNQYPYGTSGTCPNTEHWILEANAVMEDYYDAMKPITAWLNDYPGIYSVIHYFDVYDGPADIRLERLLHEMDLGKGIINTQVSFGVKISEVGLCEEYRDQYHYDEMWGGTSSQTSHFLTAVSMAYYNLNPNDHPISTNWYQKLGWNPPQPYRAIDWDQMAVALRLIIGHEKVSDTRYGDGWRQMLAYPDQYNATTATDVEDFIRALEADLTGNTTTRDELLRRILNLPLGENAVEERTGNSFEDLLLSLKGVEFGGQIRMGRIATSQGAAMWLRGIAE